MPKSIDDMSESSYVHKVPSPHFIPTLHGVKGTSIHNRRWEGMQCTQRAKCWVLLINVFPVHVLGNSCVTFFARIAEIPSAALDFAEYLVHANLTGNWRFLGYRRCHRVHILSCCWERQKFHLFCCIRWLGLAVFCLFFFSFFLLKSAYFSLYYFTSKVITPQDAQMRLAL